jgi:NTE family protein
VQKGAIWELAAWNREIVELCGTSGGALVAAAFASGMSEERMSRLMREVNPAALLDPNIVFPGLFTWHRNSRGVFSGARILRALRENLPPSFSDCHLPLTVVTFNLELGRHELWSSELTPDADLPLVVRASMSLPLIFDPVALPVPGQKKSYLHADGGIGANFPLNVFGDYEEVIGLRFAPITGPRSIVNKLDMISACIDGLIESTTREHVEDAVHARQIYLRSTGGTLDFNLTQKKIQILEDEGVESVRRWMSSPVEPHKYVQ